MKFKHQDIINIPESREVIFEKHTIKYVLKELLFHEINGCKVFKTNRATYFIRENELGTEVLFEIEKHYEPKTKEFVMWMLFSNKFSDEFTICTKKIEFLEQMHHIENIITNILNNMEFFKHKNIIFNRTIFCAKLKVLDTPAKK